MVTQTESSHEYAIARVISQKVNDDQKHPYDKRGRLTYSVRWYTFDSDDDTFKSTERISHSKTFDYYKRIKQL